MASRIEQGFTILKSPACRREFEFQKPRAETGVMFTVTCHHPLLAHNLGSSKAERRHGKCSFVGCPCDHFYGSNKQTVRVPIYRPRSVQACV